MPKISALTSLAQADVVTTTDVLPIVDATAPATTKKVTVQAMVNAGLATLTTLPSGIVNASISSITPSGGTLSINGSAIVSNRLETQGFQGAFFGNAGGVYTTWGTASPVGDIGTGNVIIGGGSASDFALNVRGANILHLCSGDVSRVAVNASGAAVTGSISATSLVDISAAGAGQIKFPATQNASADANTLDDYEEGTWTPTLPNGGTIAAASGTSCVYTKIGRQVTVIGYVEFSSVPNDSVIFVIEGLPYFPVSLNVNPYGAGAISYSGAADTSDFGGPLMSNGAARIYFHLKSGSSAAVANSTIVARGIDAFIFSLTYFV